MKPFHPKDYADGRRLAEFAHVDDLAPKRTALVAAVRAQLKHLRDE